MEIHLRLWSWAERNISISNELANTLFQFVQVVPFLLGAGFSGLTLIELIDCPLKSIARRMEDHVVLHGGEGVRITLTVYLGLYEMLLEVSNSRACLPSP